MAPAWVFPKRFPAGPVKHSGTFLLYFARKVRWPLGWFFTIRRAKIAELSYFGLTPLISTFMHTLFSYLPLVLRIPDEEGRPALFFYLLISAKKPRSFFLISWIIGRYQGKKTRIFCPLMQKSKSTQRGCSISLRTQAQNRVEKVP